MAPHELGTTARGHRLRRLQQAASVVIIAVFVLAAIVSKVPDWQTYVPARVDPELARAIAVGDWQHVVELADAWHQREPASQVPNHLRQEASIRLGQLERAWETDLAARYPVPDRSPGAEFCVRWTRSLVRAQPGSASACGLLAKALARTDDRSGALEAAGDGVRLAPGESRAHQIRAAACAQNALYEGALDDATEAVELAPRDVNAYLARAFSRQSKGQYAGAISDYTTVIGLAPGHAFVYANRASCDVSKGDFKAALADYDTAISLDPKCADTYRGRGEAHHWLDADSSALVDFEQAIALDPEDASAWYGKGQALEALGRAPEAIEMFRQTRRVALQSPDAEAEANALKALYRLGAER